MIGSQIIELKETSSTNTYAKQIAADKNYHGTIVNAVFQNAGKGHLNNTWESKKGQNLTFSIILYFNDLKAEDQFLITKFVSISITNYLTQKDLFAQIKWPNDIYVNDKKIAGILIENTIKGNIIDHSIIGVGININQVDFESNAPNPVSLAQLSNCDYNLKTELELLIGNLNEVFPLLYTNAYDKLDALYLEHMYKYNTVSNFKVGNNQFIGIIKGVNNFGQLQIEQANKVISTHNFKEIEFVIP